MNRIIVEYNSSVMVPAGWRQVTIKAEAEKTSEKMATVITVLEIDGEEPTGYTSRTGAKRQTYHAAGIAQREVGMKKRLSSCTVFYPD
jgi:hypothetical protein